MPTITLPQKKKDKDKQAFKNFQKVQKSYIWIPLNGHLDLVNVNIVLFYLYITKLKYNMYQIHCKTEFSCPPPYTYTYSSIRKWNLFSFLNLECLWQRRDRSDSMKVPRPQEVSCASSTQSLGILLEDEKPHKWQSYANWGHPKPAGLQHTCHITEDAGASHT